MYISSFLRCYGDTCLQGHCQRLQLHCDMIYTEEEDAAGSNFDFSAFPISFDDVLFKQTLMHVCE